MRLHEVTVGSQGVGPGFILGLAECSEHNNFGMLKTLGISKDVEHLEPTDAWHHNVGNDKFWLFFFGNHKRLFAVHGRYDVIAFGL